MLSIVITTYNRRRLVCRSIDSALKFSRDILPHEVLVVDDCSTDNTRNMIEARYHKEINEGILRYLLLEKNIGVTGAKNAGAKASRYKFVAFLDSDDELVSNSRGEFKKILNKLVDESIIFFRSVSNSGDCVGQLIKYPVMLDIDSYIIHGTYGESFPVVRRDVILDYPYPESLRGVEGLSYFNIIKNGFLCIVYPLVVRRYDQSGVDRLSTYASVRRRSKSIAIGYFLMLRSGWRALSCRSLIILILKICLNYLRAFTFWAFGEKNR